MASFEKKYANQLRKQQRRGNTELIYRPGSVAVKTIAREHRAAHPLLPDRKLVKSMGAGAEVAVKLFERDWIIVEHLDIEFRDSPVLPVSETVLPELHYEVDGDIPRLLRKIGPDSISRSLLAPQSVSLEEEIRSTRGGRSKASVGLRRAYPMMNEEFTSVERRMSVAPSEETQGVKLQIAVESMQLSFGPGVEEPFYFTMALWDSARGLKLSEDFVGPISGAGQALFSTPQRTADVVLIIHVCTILRGASLDHLVEPYMNASHHNQKAQQKLRDDLLQSHALLASYRQAFAFCALPLFHADGSLLASSAGSSPHLLHVYPKGGLNAEFITSRLGPLVKDRKLRAIPGSIVVNVSEVADASKVAGRIGPHGIALRPEAPRPSVFEIQPFFEDPVHLTPCYEFNHMLFVAPTTLNFSRFSGAVKGRNLVLEVFLKDSDSDPLTPGLPVLFGRRLSSNMQVEKIASAATSVTYHEKKPTFFEEFKIALPVSLPAGSHLLFLISHVNCKLGAATGTNLKTPVGFAWLPLCREDGSLLLDGPQHLPISASFPSRYTSPETEEGDLLKWIEKRPLLSVNVRIASSITPADPHLRAFFARMSNADDDGDHTELLGKASDSAIVSNFPVVLDLIFGSFASVRTSEAGVVMLLAVLDRFTHAMQTSGQVRDTTVDSYLAFALSLPVGCKGEDAVVLFTKAVCSVLRPGRAFQCELACRFAYVITTTVVKWLFLSADANHTLGDDLTRPTRFPPSLQEAVHAMIDAFINQLHVFAEERIGLAKELGRTLSFLLLDLLSVMDRGFVLDLISRFVSRVGSPADAKREGARAQLLQSCKMDALNILCSHEHFVGLNLPPASVKMSSSRAARPSRHFLVDLLIGVVLEQQRTADKAVRLVSMTTLRNQLVKHDLDRRYQQASAKSLIFSMYFPFVTRFVRERDAFWDQYDLEEKRTALFCCLLILNHCPSTVLCKWWASAAQMERSDFFRLSCRAVLTFEYRGSGQVMNMTRDFTTTKLSRVKQLTTLRGQGQTGEGASGAGTYRPGGYQTPLAQSANNAAATLAVGGEMRAWKKQAGTLSPRSIVDEVDTTQGGGTTRAWKSKAAMSSPAATSTSVESAGVVVGEEDIAVVRHEMHLSREVVLGVLDVTMLYVENFRTKQDTLSNVVDVFVSLLHIHTTDDTFAHIAAAWRVSVLTFRDELFVRPSTGYAQQITYRLLMLFNSRNGSIRRAAASLVYLMMRENWKARGNCQRMKLALNIGINRCSDPSMKLKLAENLFVESLDVLKGCVVHDSEASSLADGASFQRTLEEVSQLLLGVLRNVVRINQFAYDPERLADLYEQLCESYRSSPDLRAAWLHTLAAFHTSQGNFEEAAQCRVHMSALVSAYLSALKPREAVRVDHVAFLGAAPNVGPEFVTGSILQAWLSEQGDADEGSSSLFSRVGLFSQLEESVSLLKQDSLFESCIAVARLMCSIHQGNRDWTGLAQRYGELGELCQRITVADQEHNRMFAKWYRVVLFGEVFGPIAQAYVYKERAEVMISTLVDRLRAQYGRKDVEVHVVANTEPMPVSAAPGHVYLQVCAIQPFHEPGEGVARSTDFERQSNVNKFVMETPFTKSGKGAHGNWDDQCMRKTIISVAKCFPYLTKRLSIVREESFVLQPIENALSVIQDRVMSLTKENESTRPSTKTVQQVLAGSVLLQVNPGPLVICEVFLSPENRNKFSALHVQLLQKALSDFIAQSRALLLLNGTLIDSSQLDYQAALTHGYNDMRAKLEPFLGTEVIAAPVDPPVVGSLDDSTIR